MRKNVNAKFLFKVIVAWGLLIELSLRSFTVTIDPGHGGPFTGARSVNGLVVEKDATLDVALRLAKLLRDCGMTVILTRTTDIALAQELADDLQKRADLTKNVDAFVSIHFNETGCPSHAVNAQKFELYVPYNKKFPEQSYMLAACIHTQLAHVIEPRWAGKLGNLNIVDGGIRRARFNVIEKAVCPAAVLVELAYLSDGAGEAKVARPSVRQDYAKLLADGLSAYAKMLEEKKEASMQCKKIKRT